MKKQSFRVVLKKVLMVSGIAAGVVLSLPATSKANTNNGVDSVNLVEKQANVQYLGIYDNSVWFNVKYANPRAEKFELIIKNENNDILFQGKFSDKDFSKKIKILKEQDELKPTFVLRTQNGEVEQSFVVNTTSRVVEDVVVTKL
jgi:hypothetical protein